MICRCILVELRNRRDHPLILSQHRVFNEGTLHLAHVSTALQAIEVELFMMIDQHSARGGKQVLSRGLMNIEVR